MVFQNILNSGGACLGKKTVGVFSISFWVTAQSATLAQHLPENLPGIKTYRGWAHM